MSNIKIEILADRPAYKITMPDGAQYIVGYMAWMNMLNRSAAEED